MLGIDIQEQSLTGGQSPFYLLPALGSDEMMRGYYNGRYRDRNFIAGQTELRYRLSDRIGIVGFLGTGEVAHSSFSVSTLNLITAEVCVTFLIPKKALASARIMASAKKRRANPGKVAFILGWGRRFETL